MNESDPSASGPAPRRGRLRRALNRLEVDRAVFFALAGRVWQFAAGPVTMVLIAARFSPQTQGYYYTFGSLTALQALVELGLYSVLSNLAGHAWAGLRWEAARRGGTIAGDPAAAAGLKNLDAFAGRWYGVAAILFAAVVGSAGHVFFASSLESGVSWRLPWWTLVGLTAASLRLTPRLALLEGCGHVAAVQRCRLAQAVAGNAVGWPLILAGAGLWVVPAVAAVKFAAELSLVRFGFADFFREVRRAGPERAFDWRREVWPLQWRVAVHSVFVYAAVNVVTPVIFHYRGPEEAGRLGMTLNILVALQSAALAWVQTRSPLFSRLAAAREYRELDRVWGRVTRVSLVVVAAGAAAFVAAVAGLALAVHLPGPAGRSVGEFAGSLSGRLLPAGTAAVFALALVLRHVPVCQGIYLRAHKVEPQLAVNVACNVLSALLVWQLGRRYGSLGAGSGDLAVVAILLLPASQIVWRQFRKDRASGGRAAVTGEP